MSGGQAAYLNQRAFLPIPYGDCKVGDLIANGGTITKICTEGERSAANDEPVPDGKVRLVTGTSGWHQADVENLLVIGRRFDWLIGARIPGAPS